MDKVSIHTQSHLCILKLDSLFIVPIVRFSAVSLYAKRFLSCKQNYYASRKIRWSATYGDSVFISQFWRRITNYYSDWTFSLNKPFTEVRSRAEKLNDMFYDKITIELFTGSEVIWKKNMEVRNIVVLL